jgi:hypothetical protein
MKHESKQIAPRRQGGWRIKQAKFPKSRRHFLNRPVCARGTALGFIALAFFSFCAVPALAEPPKLSVELNKLEPQGSGCRAYVVVQNDEATAYQSYKLDIVLFQQDGVIGRRFSMDLAPLKPQKRTVKLFDLDNIPCDKIGSFLINDVVECKAEAGPIENCLAGMTVKSLTSVQLSK